MSVIQIHSRRRASPALDRGHPANAGMLFFNNFLLSPYGPDIVGNNMLSPQAGPIPGATSDGSRGVFLDKGSSQYLLFNKTVVIPSSTPFTMFGFASYHYDQTDQGRLFSLRATSNTPIVCMGTGSNGVGGSNDTPSALVRDDSSTLVQGSVGSAIADRNPHWFIVRRTAGGSIVISFDNTHSSLGTANGSISFTPASCAWGLDPKNTGLDYWHGVVLFGGMCLRNCWTDKQIARLVANPYEIFAPSVRYVPLPAPATTFNAAWAVGANSVISSGARAA